MLAVGCSGGDSTPPFAKVSEVIDAEVSNDALSALQRATAYARSADSTRYDSAVIISEKLLTTETAHTDPAFRQNVLELLVYVFRQLEDYELQLDYCSLLAEAYKEQGATCEALRTQAEMGAVLCRLGKTDEGMEKLNDAIQELTPTRRFNELDASIISIKRKIGVEHDYQDIISGAQQILARLSDYEQHPDEFSDGSSREPAPEERAGYISFYRSQAWMYLASANANLNRLGEARKYLAMAEQTEFGKTLAGRKMTAPTLRILGDYEKMERIYEELESLFVSRGDTLTLDYAQLLLDRAKAYEQQGRLEESNDCWEKHAHILQKADNRLLYSKASLYASRYHAKEQQMAIREQQEEIRQKTILCTFLAVELLILLAVILYILRQQYILRQKDAVLVREITEAIKLRDQYETAVGSHETPADNEQEADNLDALSDEQLFDYICKVVMRDELFLDPTLDRQALCERLSLTKEQIGSAFSKGSPFKSVTDFINNCRLPYAAKLLIERPDLSVAEVARISGFTRADTLTTNFKRRYTLTPTQYRTQLS